MVIQRYNVLRPKSADTEKSVTLIKKIIIQETGHLRINK